MLKLILRSSALVVFCSLTLACAKSKKKSGASASPPPPAPTTTAPESPAPPPAGPVPAPAPLPAPGANPGDLRYRYAGDNCDTGEQTFTSLNALCAALLNEQLNGRCAFGDRQADYQRRCSAFGTQPGQTPGQVTPGNSSAPGYGYPSTPGYTYPGYQNGSFYPGYSSYPSGDGC